VKIKYYSGLFTLLFFLFFSCDTINNGGPSEEDQIDTSPVFTEESTLVVHVYTEDEVMPAGDLTLNVWDYKQDNVLVDTMIMQKGPSEFTGLSLWEANVNIGNLGDNRLLLEFVNADGKKALGPMGFEDPWWRVINAFRIDEGMCLDDEAGIYEFNEVLRHWEGISSGSNKTVTGKVFFEDGTDATNYIVEEGSGQQVYNAALTADEGDSSLSFAFTQEENLVENSSFNIEVGPINTFDYEDEFPRASDLSIDINKNFYHSSNHGFNYNMLHNTETLDIGEKILSPNRQVSLEWSFSNSGVFTGTESPETGMVNTVERYSFTDYKIANFYYESLGDTNLSDQLNSFYLDNMMNIGFRLYGYYRNSSFTARLSAFGGVCSVADLTNAEVASTYPVVDLTDSSIEWTSSVSMDSEPGQIIGIKSDLGYALIKLTDIHVMTKAEIEQIESDYYTQAPAASASRSLLDMAEVRQIGAHSWIK